MGNGLTDLHPLAVSRTGQRSEGVIMTTLARATTSAGAIAGDLGGVSFSEDDCTSITFNVAAWLGLVPDQYNLGGKT